MNLAFDNFKKGIESVKGIFPIYDHLESVLHLPSEISSDILRAQVVYAVSELDRLIHELVRIGLLEIFEERRKQTKKFNSQTFKASTIKSLIKIIKDGNIPQSPEEVPEFLINKEVQESLGKLAFQAPDKIMDALSFIWEEQHKMFAIANLVDFDNVSGKDKQTLLKQRLQLITTRRNQIVHEADFDSEANCKRDINRKQVEESVNFIETIGNIIYKCVTNESCYHNY